jgi:hypothetical protein
VGKGGGFGASGDVEFGEDVGYVNALAVLGLMYRLVAIWPLECPSATRASTSHDTELATLGFDFMWPAAALITSLVVFGDDA